MADLSEINVATVDGRSVSLREVLGMLKADGNLHFLFDAVGSILVAEAAAKEGLSVSDEELQQAADNFRQQRGLQAAEVTQQWFKQNAMTVDDLKDRLTRALLAKKLKSHLAAGKEERYFAEHRLDFDAATISHIVVEDEGLANELKSQIDDEDEDFSVLARQHSIDTASARAGGYVGRVTRKALSPAVQAAVFGAIAGAVVGPIKTDQGYHVIQVETIDDSGLDEAKKAVIADTLFDAYLADMRRTVHAAWEMWEHI